MTVTSLAVTRKEAQCRRPRPARAGLDVPAGARPGGPASPDSRLRGSRAELEVIVDDALSDPDSTVTPARAAGTRVAVTRLPRPGPWHCDGDYDPNSGGPESRRRAPCRPGARGPGGRALAPGPSRFRVRRRVVTRSHSQARLGNVTPAARATQFDCRASLQTGPVTVTAVTVAQGQWPRRPQRGVVPAQGRRAPSRSPLAPCRDGGRSHGSRAAGRTRSETYGAPAAPCSLATVTRDAAAPRRRPAAASAGPVTPSALAWRPGPSRAGDAFNPSGRLFNVTVTITDSEDSESE